MKQHLELFSSISQIIVGWSIALGSIIILLYCMDINFYPKGIEIGDGLFFIWTSLSFGGRLIITILVFSAIGLSLYSLLATLINFIPKVNIPRANTSEIWPVHILTTFIVIFVALAAAIRWLDNKVIPDLGGMYWLTLLSALLMNGFIATALIEDKEQTDNTNNSSDTLNDSPHLFTSGREKQRRIFYVVFSLMLVGIPFLFIKGFGGRILNLSMTDLGIKKENVSLYLNEESSLYVKNLVEKGKYDIFLVPVGNEKYRVDNASILFQGIGDISHIALKTQQGDLRFDLPSSSLTVGKESTARPKEELAQLALKELPDVLNRHEIAFNPDTQVISFSEKYSEFRVGSSELSLSFESVLNESIPLILDFLNNHQELIKEIEVIGYSSNEWKNADSQVDAYLKNHELAISRSLNFVKHLYENENIHSRISYMNNMITIKGMSSNTSKNKRTVEIRVVPRLNKKNQADE